MKSSRLVRWARRKSPWLFHVDTGGCNGCSIEVLAALTPLFDVERFGCILTATPRHADIMAVTGAITKKSKSRLIRVYEQMPEPKVVVAIGSCPASGGVYKGSPTLAGPLDEVIPVDYYIPGCPPRPEAIIYGLANAFEALKKK